MRPGRGREMVRKLGIALVAALTALALTAGATRGTAKATRAPAASSRATLTVDANGVDATAGVVFLDAQGSVDRSLVTGLDVDESADGYTVPGGFRNNAFGIGIAAATRVRPPASGTQAAIATRTITIDHTRVERYNAVGVLVDAATSDYSPSGTTPLQASGVP